MVVLEGINDIGIPGAFGLTGEAVSAEDIIAGHAAAHRPGARQGARHLRRHPHRLRGEPSSPRYFTAAGEAKRQAVNHWIRTSGAYDAVIDFDRAYPRPANPSRLLPAYDSGDHLHPNDVGYEAMARAVDLSLFRRGH